MTDPLRPESLAVAAGRPHAPGAPLNTPIVPLTASRFDGQENRYSRYDVSPTVASLEAVVGALEGGRTLAFSSGMAGVATLVSTLPAGAVVAAPVEAYSNSVLTFRAAADAGRLDVRWVDPSDTPTVVAAADGAELVWLETVSNPLMTVADVPAVAAAVHASGGVLAVDATFSTPLTARPLDLGADVAMHSGTKYLAGHSDALIGVLTTRDDHLHTRLWDARTLHGGIPGVLEAYLTTRGVRTLALRWERQQANALDLAGRLADDPRVTRVRFPGLPADPGHALATRDHAGYGAIIGVEVDSAGRADDVCARVRLITHATSLGGVESTIERRAAHAVDATFGTPGSLLRLSVGIEHVEDLWADLDQALG